MIIKTAITLFLSLLLTGNIIAQNYKSIKGTSTEKLQLVANKFTFLHEELFKEKVKITGNYLSIADTLILNAKITQNSIRIISCTKNRIKQQANFQVQLVDKRNKPLANLLCKIDNKLLRTNKNGIIFTENNLPESIEISVQDLHGQSWESDFYTKYFTLNFKCKKSWFFWKKNNKIRLHIELPTNYKMPFEQLTKFYKSGDTLFYINKNNEITRTYFLLDKKKLNTRQEIKQITRPKNIFKNERCYSATDFIAPELLDTFIQNFTGKNALYLSKISSSKKSFEHYFANINHFSGNILKWEKASSYSNFDLLYQKQILSQTYNLTFSKNKGELSAVFSTDKNKKLALLELNISFFDFKTNQNEFTQISTPYIKHIIAKEKKELYSTFSKNHNKKNSFGTFKAKNTALFKLEIQELAIYEARIEISAKKETTTIIYNVNNGTNYLKLIFNAKGILDDLTLLEN